MTVEEAIERASLLYPSSKENNDLYGWLNELEARICGEIHGCEYEEITSSSGARTLVVPDAYAELYPLYLMMKTDLANSDIARFNNHSAVFNRAYADYANYKIRTGEPADTIYYTLP